MNQLTALLQDRWYVLVVALIVVIIIIKAAKAVVKWVLILALIAVIAVYGAHYASAFKDKIEEQAIHAMATDAKDAKYQKNPDGSYTISTGSFKLEGKPGSNDVKITILNKTVTLKIDETVQKFIDQAKEKAGQ